MIARNDALSAHATEHAAKEWGDADKLMGQAGRAIEKGDQNEARKKATEATGRFRDAELQAIRTDLLGTASVARTEALELKADESSPVVFANAEKFLQQAEATLKATVTSAPWRWIRLGRDAGVQARRDHAEVRDGGGFEEAREHRGRVLKIEKGVSKLASDLNVEVDYSQGLVTVLGYGPQLARQPAGRP